MARRSLGAGAGSVETHRYRDAERGGNVFRTDPAYVRQAKRLFPSSTKRAAGHLLRGVGMVTSPWRPLPDFMLVGAKRCGSTSLFTYLLEHPDVASLFPAAEGKKGSHYFDRHSDRSTAWYRSHFAVRRPGRITGEASTYYFSHPRAAHDAAALVPSARIIALLREPAARAFSHYRDEVKLGNETLSFADALAAEGSRLAPEIARMDHDPHYYSFAHEHLSYRTWGLYADHLSRWLSVYPTEQVLVLRSEDMFTQPEVVFRRCTDFLGLSPFQPEFRRHNAAPPASPDSAVLQELQEYYVPHNARLAELLPLALTWT